MPLAAFILGLLSLVVAVFALTWNVVSWVLSAGRPRCLLLHGYHRPDGYYTYDLVAKDGQPRTTALGEALSLGYGGEEVLGVEVQNRGRAPLIVTSFGPVIEPLGKFLAVPKASGLGPDTPHTIPAGDVAQWWVRTTDIKEAAFVWSEGRPSIDARAYMTATTAHRKKARTRRSLRLALGMANTTPSIEGARTPTEHQTPPSQGSSSEVETTEPGPQAAS